LQVWIDVFVPRTDELFEDDVVKSFAFVGRSWADGLRASMVTTADRGADLQLAPGRPGRPSTWAKLLCFGGLGASEATIDGRKVVGISQRRDRHGAWFHSVALLDLGAAELANLLADPALRSPAAIHLEAVAAAVPGGSSAGAALTEYVLASLPHSA
jgi:lipoate-protein ligase A